MSVIRQPEVLGRTTQRRLVGVTAALSATVVEALAVGLWFGLVVESRSTTTALAGLGILFCGSLLRAGVFGVAVSNLGDLLQPQRLATTLVLTAGWIVWLWLAELLGGVGGVLVATTVLVMILIVQLTIEQRVFRCGVPPRIVGTPVGPALVLATGAGIALATAWFVEWSITSPAFSLGVTALVLRVDAIHVGLAVFAICSFLAHQWRFQHVLGE